MSAFRSHGLIGLFARHPVAANLLMLMLWMAGAVALYKLNVQFFPNFALDMVQVRVVWPGANAEDVERAITVPIEQALRNEDGLDEMTSVSSAGASLVVLRYQDGVDIVEAVDRVRQKVDALRNLPQDIEKPIIARFIRYERVAKVTLVSETGDLLALRQWARDFEQELLRRGIDKVDFIGLPPLQLKVAMPLEMQRRSERTLAQWGAQLAAQSLDLPAGTVGDTEGGRELRVLEQARDPLALARLSMPWADMPHLQLRDVAQVHWAVQRYSPLAWVGQARAVTLELKRAEEGDTLKSAQIMAQWLDETRPKLPPGMQLIVHDETWSLVKQRMMLLVENGLSGLLLVVAILYLFMNGRVAFWVAVGIPTSFAAALAILWLSGGSINMISLFALIMALGIIVDDAIVVGEDALAHYEAGETPLQAAEGGAHRMLAPVTAASLTTVAAFLPLMMVGGEMGKIMFAIPLVIIAVIIASLIESFLVLPGHLRHTFAKLHQRQPSRLRQRLEAAIDHFRFVWFRALIRWALHHRAVVLATTLGLMIMAVGLLAGGRLGFVFFPSPEANKINAWIQFTAGTPAQQTQAFARRVLAAAYRAEAELEPGVLKVAQMVLYQSERATGVNHAAVRIELKDSDQRHTRNADFIAAWRKHIGALPPGLEQLSIAAPLMGPSGKDFEVQLYGADPRRLKQASLALQQALAQLPGVSSIEDDLPYGRDQLILHLTPQAKALGLDVQSLVGQLSSALSSRLVQIFTRGQEEVALRIALPDEERDRLSLLKSLYIQTPQGWAPLDQLVWFGHQQGFDVFRHVDGRLGVTVRADVDAHQNNANRILAQFKQTLFPELEKQFGVKVNLQGRAKSQQETLTDMKIGMWVGVILIYIILAWVFGSYGWPLLVMTAIPFGLIGAIFGHWIMGLDLTILSLFGFFGLAGIVVNDSIILVSFYKQLREQGMAVQQALEEAAVRRVRAVLLTSLTTIAGLLPLLFEKSLQAQFLIPMATSIAFGLMASTLLILLVVPVLLSLYEQMAPRRLSA